MTNSKSTKRALLFSVLSVMMCVAMLIGTTFAWFTDTASTNVNKIQAGNLDVELLDADGNSLENSFLSWQKAAGHEDDEVLWEPGCTYNLQPITIKNNGNLALKYKVIISGIKGDEILNNAIEWTIKLDETDYVLDSEHKLAKQDSDILTISGHMKKEAGNEYQGLSIDGVAITVVATQEVEEYDSSRNNYDADATYPIVNVTPGNTVGEINSAIDNALASGTDRITVKVADQTAETPIAIDSTTAQKFKKVENLTLNIGENVSLSFKEKFNNYDNERYIVPEGQTLRITGKGTINNTNSFGAAGGATLIIDNEGGFIRNSVGTATIHMASCGANVIVKNYDISNPDGYHPLIAVGDMDSVISPNGFTTPSKLTLENVTMNNIVHSESAGAWVPGGMGIQVWKGNIDITTKNVTFNDGTNFNVVKNDRGTSDNAFLTIATINNPTVTLNGVNQ